MPSGNLADTPGEGGGSFPWDSLQRSGRRKRQRGMQACQWEFGALFLLLNKPHWLSVFVTDSKFNVTKFTYIRIDWMRLHRGTPMKSGPEQLQKMHSSFIAFVHAHTRTYIHTSYMCANKLSHTDAQACSYAQVAHDTHRIHTLMHTPLTHEQPYAHTAHIYVHACMHIYIYVHVMYTRSHRTSFILQPAKLRCTTVRAHAARKVTGLWNVP